MGLGTYQFDVQAGDDNGQVEGLRGPTMLERALFPRRLVFRAGLSAIPYNCLNPRIVAELMALRRSWTLFTSREKGSLKDAELKTMLNVYGSAWLKEYWAPFSLVVAGMLFTIGAATAAFGVVGCVGAALLSYGAYVWWVSATMNVIRPGELAILLPYLRLDGADRAYLEAVDALSQGNLEHSHRMELLGTLNLLLERDLALQQSLGSRPLSVGEADPELDALQARAAETAGTPLGEVYAETVLFAQRRVTEHRKAEAQDELLRASRRLILEKIWSIRDTLKLLRSASRSETVPGVVESLEFDSQSLVRALEEAETLQQRP